MTPHVVQGLDRDLAAKNREKAESPELESLIRKWYSDVTGESLPSVTLYEALKDGVALCKLAQKIDPTNKYTISTSTLPFKQMENINNFLTVAKKWGTPEYELFQTIDLYENKNMYQVMLCIVALSRNAHKAGYTGPLIGPKLAEKQSIHFTDEQLARSRAEVGLQYGYTDGANQSGIIYGKRREVADTAIDPNAISH